MQLSSTLGVQRWALEVERLYSDAIRFGVCPRAGKNVTIFNLPKLSGLLHLVCPTGQPRYYLLLTGIHRLFAPLFTNIRILFRTLTLPHRHDSTKTRNSARFT